MQRFFRSFLIVIMLVLAACGEAAQPTTTTNQTSGPVVGANDLLISITYSPEKTKWLEERITTFNNQNVQSNGKRVIVEGKELSSGTARTQIRAGQLQTTIWTPSASTWLEVLKKESNNPTIAEADPQSLVLTPVVISMWKPMAEAMGYPGKEVGWSDMLALIQDTEGWGKFGQQDWGRFSWGHTDPDISTTALSTVLAELYAANGKTSDLTVEDINQEKSQQFLRDLAQGIKHYGSNTLVFSQNMQKYGMAYISAFPMEEITLIDFNKQAPNVPLVAIYPKEGTFIHDNPFIVMSDATADQKAAASVFYDFLLTPESQNLAMQQGFRPANVDVALASPLTAQFGVDPNQPRNSLATPPADVIVAAKNAWANNRKPANIMLVVDSSGSMRDDDKMDQAKLGVEVFLNRLPSKDNVGMIGFSSSPAVLVPLATRSENMANLQMQTQGLVPDGNTSLYDAIDLARQELENLKQPDRINAIVVLSDGADTASQLSIDQMLGNFGESSIQIFPIAYGADAETSILQQIADFSRTELVQGSTGDIDKIFENLSRYF
ncbi:MAG TPA: VWA domain-containing protein [Herpetosiphon sp.]|uniref:von Willebrand factor type A n=1 Tax=Herpetosiphon aurantiacus (strain ATCC 23779 / DSM 785 / 114-95) TaxID=316274 RepID=A9B607_HERA2|nr:VWA domain-containing protein [Herpetosiphon sp.]ABX05800.1 von Willebrand factor type A [Herpetosiphon aurantiacus DSM 785]HBW49436.1 VWA domain-containing protein [Herpetosiphon sp.]